ncbi:MAG: arylesterase [Verrucomicrobiae bacterium]|nr:arylesterase [Verrucomicrobiae bacterium]
MKRSVIAMVAALALVACGRGEHATGNGPIVAFGDSLTAGYGADQGESYPEVMSKILGEPVINRGVSGNTTADGLQRLDSDVLASNPRLVVVWLGANDELQQLPVADAEKNLGEIVDRLKARGVFVILVGVPDIPFRPSYNDRIRELARAKKCVYIDKPMAGILGDREMKSDEVHPNANGYALIAERFAVVVKKYAGP